MKRAFLFPVLMTFLIFSSCKLGRFVYYNFADITDYKIFPYRTATAPEHPFTFAQASHPKFPKKINMGDKNYAFDSLLQDNQTVAFLIIQNDSIQYERYFHNYDEKSVVASFSMAKSITSILMGIAIDEGLIQSIEEPITNYIPELKSNGFDDVTIHHLLQMTSGLNFNEGYKNPFGHVATFYYGTNLRKAINKLKLKNQPGKHFDYTSGTTQLLGLVLERALKSQTITSYLEQKLWQPLGMEFDATWSLDRKKNGLEKTFCCVNARARDFAKIGRLYLHKGNWNGKQIVPEKWVKESTRLDTSDGSTWFYQYQWWLPGDNGQFYAQGILGQYIFVDPNRNLVMVRLGEKVGNVNWIRLFTQIASSY